MQLSRVEFVRNVRVSKAEGGMGTQLGFLANDGGVILELDDAGWVHALFPKGHHVAFSPSAVASVIVAPEPKRK